MSVTFENSSIYSKIPEQMSDSAHKVTYFLLQTKTEKSFLFSAYFHYFVPNNRSPASPNPGTIYPFSFSFSSMAAK